MVGGGEVAGLGGDEVPGDLGCDGEHGAVGDHGDAADALVVVADEAEVREHAGEVVPAGEGLGLDHQALEWSVLFEPGVEVAGEAFEIIAGERAQRMDDQDAVVGKQFVSDHWIAARSVNIGGTSNGDRVFRDQRPETGDQKLESSLFELRG